MDNFEMTNGVTWSDGDVKLVEKFIEIRNRGFYCDSKQLTDVYNRVLHKRANVTSCGQCLRQRVTELEQALNRLKQQMAKEATETAVEPTKEETLTPVKEEENKSVRSKKKK